MKKFLKWLDEDFEECVMMILLVLIAVVRQLQDLYRFIKKNFLKKEAAE